VANTRLQDLDRRYLEILEVGGPRKPNVLKAIAPSARDYRASIARLRSAGLVRHIHRHGGPHVSLTRKAHVGH
jgi:hypothetical protein